MARARTTTSPDATRIRYSPRSFVRAPIWAPTMPMVASVTETPLPTSVTLPVISRVCEMRLVGANARATTSDAKLRRTEAPRDVGNQLCTEVGGVSRLQIATHIQRRTQIGMKRLVRIAGRARPHVGGGPV